MNRFYFIVDYKFVFIKYIIFFQTLFKMMFLDDLGIDGETFTSIDASMYSPRSNSNLSNNPLATSPTPHKPALLGSDNREDTNDAWLPLSVASSSEMPSVDQHATQVPLSEEGIGGVSSAVAMEGGVVATTGLSPRKRGRPRKVKQEIIKSAGGASVKQVCVVCVLTMM